MDIKCNHFLKPLFTAVGSIGIGLPHDGYEVPLMMAGKKPCLITDWPLTQSRGEDYTQLEPLINAGQIHVIAIKEHQYPTHIICQPQDSEACQSAALIMGKSRSGELLTQEEWQKEKAFLETYCGIPQWDKDRQAAMDHFNQRSRNPEKEYQLLLSGQIKATLPVMTGENLKNTPQTVQARISSGDLCAVHVQTRTSSFAILAQKDCTEMGTELFARYWGTTENYAPLSERAEAKRIGHLLGYTEADTEFFVTVGTQPISKHRLMDKLRIASFDAIRYARVQSMLMDADNTPKPL